MDQQIVLALYHWASAQPKLAALVVLIAQDGIFLVPLALGLLCLLPGPGTRRRREAAVAGAVAFVLAVTLAETLGPIVGRPRPFVALALVPLFMHKVSPSFPSSHTLFGVALVGPLIWRLPRVGIWLVLWTLVVGFARVAAAVHYPSDILGSALLAVVPTALGLWLTALLVGRLPILRALLQAGAP